MPPAVQKFPDSSEENLDWRFITEHLLLHMHPYNHSRIPQLDFRGRFIPTGTSSTFYRDGTPWGRAGWRMKAAGGVPLVWDTSGNLSRLPLEEQGWTIACIFRASTPDTWWRLIWRLIFGSGSYTQLEYTSSNIRVSTFTGLIWLRLTLPFTVTADQWLALCVTFRSGAGGARRIRVATIDDNYSYGTAFDARTINLQAVLGIDAVRLGGTGTAGADGTLGSFVIVDGDWLEGQFKRWATDPYAWADRYTQRGVSLPATCPHGDGRIRPLVNGKAGVDQTVVGQLYLAQAIDGDALVGPAISGEDSVQPAVSGKASICEGDDGRH